MAARRGEEDKTKHLELDRTILSVLGLSLFSNPSKTSQCKRKLVHNVCVLAPADAEYAVTTASIMLQSLQHATGAIQMSTVVLSKSQELVLLTLQYSRRKGTRLVGSTSARGKCDAQRVNEDLSPFDQQVSGVTLSEEHGLVCPTVLPGQRMTFDKM